MSRLLPLVLLLACGAETPVDPSPRQALNANWGDFPSERDFAILLPLDRDPLFPASTPLDSDMALLPGAWLKDVARAYQSTAVEDALETESMPEDWRLVSLRVSPCAPIARSPAQASAELCWPIVRLVWQPVVNHMSLGGVGIDAYADDRAIHALYPVVPRSGSGARIDSSAVQSVQEIIGGGQPEESIPSSVRSAYDSTRDDTTAWLLTRLAQVRGEGLASGSWDGIQPRPELDASSSGAADFELALTGFLREFAYPTDLRELTSFSLPAGRNPSGDDIWVFLQFLSDGHSLQQNTLEVFSRLDGQLLLSYGDSQEVGMINESEAVTAALASDPAGEAHDTIVESTADIDQIADLIADPTEVFVPNTTCATCHRLNDLRFDFHALSHLEDRAHTVSPRVVQDVARDLTWVSEWLAITQPQAPSTSDDSNDTSTSATTDTSATTEPAPEALREEVEPNDTSTDANEVALPLSLSGTIYTDDVDLYRVDAPDSISIHLELDHARGDLDLYLFDAAGELLAWSETVTDEEHIEAILEPGSHYIMVYGYNDAIGEYQLSAQ